MMFSRRHNNDITIQTLTTQTVNFKEYNLSWTTPVCGNLLQWSNTFQHRSVLYIPVTRFTL